MDVLAVQPSAVVRTPAPGRQGDGSGPCLSVDLAAVAANTRLFVSRTRAGVMAVVKADGYGHGAADVARVALANGATSLGVTSVDEALPLRGAGLRAPLLSWLNDLGADFAAAAVAGVDVAVPSHDHLRVIAAAPGCPRVHLQLDVGMARDGAARPDWLGLCRAARAAEQRGRVRVVGVMGHLGCADVPADPCNAAGRDTFAWGVRAALAAGLRPQARHLAATAATLTDPLSHHTLCRVGAGLVGIDPSGTVALHPALTLTAPVVGVRAIPAGASVGYGHTWTAGRDTNLGLLGVGYADGLPRRASGVCEVMVHGRRRPIVGRVSMDQIVVDLGDDDVQPGEIVTVFGPGSAGEPTVADWAAWSGTIPQEIVTGLGARVRREIRPAAHRCRAI